MSIHSATNAEILGKIGWLDYKL